MKKTLAFKERGGKPGGDKGYLGSDELAFTLSTHADQNIMTYEETNRGGYLLRHSS